MRPVLRFAAFAPSIPPGKWAGRPEGHGLSCHSWLRDNHFVALLVTGGAGYVGSHTVRALVERGREVVVLDSMEFGHRSAVLGAELVVGSVGDSALVASILRDYDIEAVIHFAGYKKPGESVTDPFRYFWNNVGGSMKLLQSVAASQVERFVFSSTCAVYGNPLELPVKESHPLQPESPYGESKRMVEQMLRWFDACHGVRHISLRYFNAAGASLDARIGEDWTATSNLVPLAAKAALGRSSVLQVFGTDYPTEDGTAVRDYVHVVDLADAHVKAVEHLERGGESDTFNLGTGRGYSVLEVVESLEAESGMSVPVQLVARRPGDPASIWADSSAATTRLGWQPQYDLGDIVRSAWRWHSTNIDGYKD
jgi:UDP-glucose 4-epimerase